jgi:hypothetical protein
MAVYALLEHHRRADLEVAVAFEPPDIERHVVARKRSAASCRASHLSPRLGFEFGHATRDRREGGKI